MLPQLGGLCHGISGSTCCVANFDLRMRGGLLEIPLHLLDLLQGSLPARHQNSAAMADIASLQMRSLECDSSDHNSFKRVMICWEAGRFDETNNCQVPEPMIYIPSCSKQPTNVPCLANSVL